MKIKVFEGNKGDCLLVQSTDKHHILIDGGLVTRHGHIVDSYSDNVAKSLGKLRDDGFSLDLVCVSHIDQDHIGGVLRLLNDTFDWRVYDHQIEQGLTVSKPSNPRPPDINELWHNAFHEMVDQNRRSIYKAIAAAAPSATLAGFDSTIHGRHLFQDIATSMDEAVRVSRRIDASQLDIPLNSSYNGKLVRYIRNKAPQQFGNATVRVIGPTGAQLKDLRDEWNKWLDSDKGKRQTAKVKRLSEQDEQLLKNSDFETFLDNASLGPAVGNRNTVTEENVASIIMVIEDSGKTLLTTGDARDDHIVDSLKKSGIADNDGHAHFDALKVQHHGSENNFSVGFGKRVTANHYIFCGNGKHKNPDLRVIDQLIDSRIGPDSRRSPNVPHTKPFTLWFTSDGTTTDANEQHMRDVIELVKRRERESNGVLRSKFSQRSHFTISP